MTRRRRPHREIAFSFESFLDIVANVVGIIIRLILVAWLGARTYHAVVPLPPPPPAPPALADPEPLPDPSDPRLEQIARRRQELSREEQDALARRQNEHEAIDAEAERLRQQAQELAEKREELEQTQGEIQTQVGETGKKAKGLLLSVEELQKRSEKLMAQLKKAEGAPKQTKQLRYHSPVSADVQSEEVMFECQAGRVTLFDRAALEGKMVAEARKKLKELRERTDVSGVTDAVGAFRARYEVSSGILDTDVSWQVEPVLSIRGETGEQALAAGSAFRKVVDELDPQQTVVTLAVYPDSFALYRQLRDYLHDHQLVVAGRPLPLGALITFSTHGTASRGQ